MSVLRECLCCSFPPTKDYLADLDGATLSLYGAGSLEAFDRNWGVQATGTVTTISFRFVDFDEIVRQLHKIRARFPNVQVICIINIIVFSADVDRNKTMLRTFVRTFTVLISVIIWQIESHCDTRFHRFYKFVSYFDFSNFFPDYSVF